MPGPFSIASAGLKGVSLDEIRQHAETLPLPPRDPENTITKALRMLAEIGTPDLMAPTWKDGTPILLTDLSTDGEDKLVWLVEQLGDREQRKVLHKLRRFMNANKAEQQADRAKTEATVEWLRVMEDTLSELGKWGTQPGLRMERPHETMAHSLVDAILAKRAIDVTQKSGTLADNDAKDYVEMIENASVYLVEHDWAAAFKNAKEYGGGEIKLPDECCVFEFKISGRHVIATAIENHGRILMQPAALSSKGVWMLSGFARRFDDGRWGSDLFDPDNHDDHVVQILGAQVAAICIALDAEAASTEVVRAPHKLNRAREARGKLPIFDYHVVSLARRSRAARLPADPNAEPGTKRRLHFRRGHWRHYQNHKTWIKWMLVGNPDLGFVDKHYKL